MGSKRSRNKDKKKRTIVPTFEVRHEILKRKSASGVEYTDYKPVYIKIDPQEWIKNHGK